VLVIYYVKHKKSVLSESKLNEIKESFTKSPKKSLERRSQNLNISKRTCHIAASLIKIKAYKPKIAQELKDCDFVKRKSYCEWFLNFIKENVLNKTFFTEA